MGAGIPAVTNSVLSGRAGDQLGAGWRSARGVTCRGCQRVARRRAERAGLVTLRRWRSWQSKTPGGNGCRFLASEAGEEIRTPDVQLGKRIRVWRKDLCFRALCLFASVSDQLGAVRLAIHGQCSHPHVPRSSASDGGYQDFSWAPLPTSPGYALLDATGFGV